jgi:hypothetical protein
MRFFYQDCKLENERAQISQDLWFSTYIYSAPSQNELMSFRSPDKPGTPTVRAQKKNPFILPSYAGHSADPSVSAPRTV